MALSVSYIDNKSTLIIVLFLTISLVCGVFRFFSDPLCKIRGPLLARFTSLWYFHQLWRGDFQETNLALHKRYGPLVRTAPNEYSLADPGAAKIIYGHGTKFTKGDWYLGWYQPEVADHNLFALQNEKLHSVQRRKYAKLYSMTSLVQYEHHVNECIDIFVQRLNEFATSQQRMDLGHWLQCYAFDVIAKITFSYRFGFLDQGSDIDNIIEDLDKFNLGSTLIGVFPSLKPLLRKQLRHFSLIGVNSFVGKHVQDRAVRSAKGEDLSDVPDMTSKFFVENQKNPELFDNTNIFMGAAQNVVAGTDTTSIALAAIFQYLITHPNSLSALRQELHTNRESGNISSPITFNESLKLPYLQAVLKEAMRLNPSAALPMWRTVPAGGATIAGNFFPEGATVGLNPWVTHRNKDIFGADADDFRPERWINSSPEHISTMDRHWMAFGMGARTCLGKNISLLEINKLIPEVLQRFDFELNTDQIINLNRWFVKKKGFFVIVKPLKKGSN